MGKASQAKKAARLARESGQTPAKERRRLAFPLAVVGAVVVGVIVVVIARQPADSPKASLDIPTETSLVDGATVVPGADGSTTDSVPTADTVPVTDSTEAPSTTAAP